MNFINISFAENLTTVSFKNAKIFEEACIAALGDELTDVASNVESGHSVAVDFTLVNYLSSAALGKLITMNKRLKEKGCNLKLINMGENVIEIFEITRLNKFFVIEKP